MQINNIPDKMLQTFSGIFELEHILIPINLPIDKNISWKIATSIGKRKERYPIMLLPIPIPKASTERAIPR